MYKEISKAGRNIVVSAFKNRDYEKLNSITEAAKKDALEVFDAVSSGSCSVAWYDMPPVETVSGAISVLRYALHRSTKKSGFLQLSCMEIRNGQTIPTSDLQFSISDGFGDFFRELPNHAKIFMR